MCKSKFLCLCGAFLIVMSAVSSACEAAQYNRAWWLTTHANVRDQFIAGYLNCSIAEDGRTDLLKSQWNVIEARINNYYSNSRDHNASVMKLIERFDETSVSSDPAPEVHKAPWIFNGDYWRQLTPEEHVGFVNGYIACLNFVPGTKRIKWMAPSSYVDKINSYYGLTEDGDIFDKRASTQISYLMHELTFGRLE